MNQNAVSVPTSNGKAFLFQPSFFAFDRDDSGHPHIQSHTQQAAPEVGCIVTPQSGNRGCLQNAFFLFCAGALLPSHLLPAAVWVPLRQLQAVQKTFAGLEGTLENRSGPAPFQTHHAAS